ncbi:hypothetical protein LRP52_18080 [Photobacterium sp. ZSDE20]|nr:hypothetical protein [Photobacterium sp. ZSDE20]
MGKRTDKYSLGSQAVIADGIQYHFAGGQTALGCQYLLSVGSGNSTGQGARASAGNGGRDTGFTIGYQAGCYFGGKLGCRPSGGDEPRGLCLPGGSGKQ